MKHPISHIAFLLALALLTSLPGRAQQPMHQHQMEGQQAPMFDAALVETITGTVERLELKASQHHPATYGVHLLLATSEGTVEVHLGPVWYLDNQEVRLKEGDELSVTGARLVQEGMTGLIAAKIQRGEDILHLRDDKGYPAWRGGKRSGLQ